MKKNNKRTCFTMLIMLIFSTGAFADCERWTDKTTGFDIAVFSYKAMLRLHTFNYVNYQKMLTAENSGQYLTKDAWDTFYQQLVKHGILDKLKKNKSISTVGTQMGPMPIFIDEQKGKANVAMTALITYQDQKHIKTLKKNLMLTIIRDKNQCMKVDKIVDAPKDS